MIAVMMVAGNSGYDNNSDVEGVLVVMVMGDGSNEGYW